MPAVGWAGAGAVVGWAGAAVGWAGAAVGWAGAGACVGCAGCAGCAGACVGAGVAGAAHAPSNMEAMMNTHTILKRRLVCMTSLSPSCGIG